MKKVIAFTLSFILVFLLGATATMAALNLDYYVRHVLHGKPLPPMTAWSYEFFGQWDNGNILCIFILPWALLLLWAVWTRCPENSIERDIRFLYGFACMAVVEAILFVFFVLSSILPLIRIYGGFSSSVPAPLAAYVSNFLLLLVFGGIAVVGVIRILRWIKSKRGGR